ncbi:Thiopurine S-methyltransferase (TPMT) [Flavobacterium fryxellicola]|uniref:Thiopurine S-methyltransferase n=1 Tax=Flavobacterium fryxellicola TaxID=249352 RepID=A0A167ZH32_9FLAO|nr:methyltransferase domain-containing protein [Flavobacterium fryxellicola]OAB30442.1 thiopurine S-methyltransferase [Flavobacterium fryxellicola]SHN76566.1 Thiopurine S-methyltransferase (TPMT) [Flavobacterium fryxellicola]
MSDLKCGATSLDKTLDAAYWEAHYSANTTGWDLGMVAPPIKMYIDTIADKNSRILIPGCGNSYEAEYLLNQGFTNITVIDIAPTPASILQEKFKKNAAIQIILGDFFEHQGNYDLIIEQTFFCALPPTMRQKYVWKMHQLLANKGILAGLLFNRTFESGPPFGGNQEEYEMLFKGAFDFLEMGKTQNSIAPRANSELFFELRKNSTVFVNRYQFENIKCSASSKDVTEKLLTIESVLNVSRSSNFVEILIVSTTDVPGKTVQDAIYNIKENKELN